MILPFGIASGMAACSAWPASRPTQLRDVSRRLAHPPLFIAGDFDPATPAPWSRRLSAALGHDSAGVMRYRGGGHGVATRAIPCFDDAIVSYLVDLTLPPQGTTCPARPLGF